MSHSKEPLNAATEATNIENDVLLAAHGATDKLLAELNILRSQSPSFINNVQQDVQGQEAGKGIKDFEIYFDQPPGPVPHTNDHFGSTLLLMAQVKDVQMLATSKTPVVNSDGKTVAMQPAGLGSGPAQPGAVPSIANVKLSKAEQKAVEDLQLNPDKGILELMQISAKDPKTTHDNNGLIETLHELIGTQKVLADSSNFNTAGSPAEKAKAALQDLSSVPFRGIVELMQLAAQDPRILNDSKFKTQLEQLVGSGEPHPD